MTALLYRKKTLLAKLETSYGVDPVATAAANSIQTVNLSVTPLDQDRVDREEDRAVLGANRQVGVSDRVRMEFGVYAAGSGTVGSAPLYGPLLRACGLTETLFASDESAPAAWATGTDYAFGDKVTSSSNYYICILAHTAASANKPGTGADAGTFWEDYSLQPASAVYQPLSENFPSVYLEANLDGNAHDGKGARGNLQLNLSAGALPQWDFTFTGAYVPVGTATAPVLQTLGFQNPVPLTKENTPTAELGGYSMVMNSLTFDFQNDVQHINEANRDEILIVNRNVTGTLVCEMPLQSTKDFYADIRNLTEGPLRIVHGKTAGNILQIDAPKVQIASSTVQESEGRFMLSLEQRFIPVNNDEIKLTFR